MLNQTILMGRLIRDPELRKTPSGVSVVSFTLACDRDFAAKGETKQTDFIDCIAWRNTAEYVTKYFTKGRMAIVQGKLQVRDYTDKSGNRRKITELVAENIYFGDRKNSENGEMTEFGAQAFTPYEDENSPF